MTLEYKDQSVSALRLVCCAEAVDPSRFTVYAEQRFEKGPFRFHAGIIGESHFLVITDSGGKAITEVFACTRFDAINPLVALTPPNFGRSSEAGVNLGDGTWYSCRIHVQPWETVTTGVLEKVGYLTRVQREAGFGIGLSYTFPGSDERPAMTALYAEVDLKGNDLAVNVRSYHAYPNEDTLVLSESAINLVHEEKGEK